VKERNRDLRAAFYDKLINKKWKKFQ